MKEQTESAKFQPVTIDATSGSCVPTPPKIKLKNERDLRLELTRVYRDARNGKIDSSDAARFTYILISIGKMIQAENFEKRLVQIERTILK